SAAPVTTLRTACDRLLPERFSSHHASAALASVFAHASTNAGLSRLSVRSSVLASQSAACEKSVVAHCFSADAPRTDPNWPGCAEAKAIAAAGSVFAHSSPMVFMVNCAAYPELLSRVNWAACRGSGAIHFEIARMLGP